MPTFVYDPNPTGPRSVPANVTPDQLSAAQEAIATARITGSVGATVERGARAEVQRLYTLTGGINGGQAAATDLWLITVSDGHPDPAERHTRQTAAMYDALAAAVEVTEGGTVPRWSDLDLDDQATVSDVLRPVLPVVLGAVRS